MLAKLAVIVTALLGILNAHGLVEEPLPHDAPEIVQPLKLYAEFAVAVTEMAVPAE